ncbi:MAG: hypothetical protein DSY43_00410 [Gammaproteobacteria bacterium]|nr:MAG: hypothetical protein DSY43_00410 [Gammaproteobacteria bacterium]
MLSSDEICQLIPHAGAMCLIDSVEKWDKDSILCTTQTHQNQDNPLLSNGILHTSALIEYGAQAMAVHGALIAKESKEKMQKGYLAALRGIDFYQNAKINSVTSPLVIEATRRLASHGNMIYDFLITSEGEDLISGRATVVAIFND